MKELKSDIIIVGAGLTGLMTAYALSSLEINILLIDKFNFIRQKSKKYDLRTTAISEGSKEFLHKIKVWSKISKYSEAIKFIRAIDRKEPNVIDFYNKSKENNLGYVVRNTLIKSTLIKLNKSRENVKMFDGIYLENITTSEHSINVMSKRYIFSSKLLIAADGKNSFVRDFLNLKKYKKEYQKKALVVNFHHKKNHNSTAYELFFANGPLAILPMKKFKKNEFSSSVIWTIVPDQVEHLCNIKKDLIIDILEEKIYKYVGKITEIVDIQSFNLSAHINNKFYGPRTVFLGDSAHSIHPIAGQGWNIGIRDIESCLKILDSNLKLGLDIGSLFTCKKYNDERFNDAYLLFQITDKLNAIFLNEEVVFKTLRQKSFNFIDKKNKLKNLITNFAMGFN